MLTPDLYTHCLSEHIYLSTSHAYHRHSETRASHGGDWGVNLLVSLVKEERRNSRSSWATRGLILKKNKVTSNNVFIGRETKGRERKEGRRRKQEEGAELLST